MKKSKLLLYSTFLFSSASFFGQEEDLLKLLEEKPKKEYVMATFKTTRLINFHTVEVVGRRALDFRISHRFGDFNSGAFNAWGIDGGANIRLALEYSHDGRLMFGLGRTSARKIVDGFVKYRLLRQTINNSMPLSMTLFSSAFHTFERTNLGSIHKYQTFYDRMSYCNEIMVAHKFNAKFSLQFLGAIVHYNLVDNITEGNNCYLVGAVARYKLTARQALTVEYAHRLNSYSKNKYYDSFGVGYDLETGGHVFQIHLTNSFGLTENQYFMYTTSSWQNWGIRLGFNISRVFGMQRKIKD